MLDYNEFPDIGKECEVSTTELVSQRISDADSYIIYGAGINGLRTLEKLSKYGKNPTCIIDRKATGKDRIFGIPIERPDYLESVDKNTPIIITPTQYCVDIEEYLRDKGFVNLLFIPEILWYVRFSKGYRLGADLKLKVKTLNHEKIQTLLKALADDKSRQVFNAEMELWLTGSTTAIQHVSEGNFIYADGLVALSHDEVYVDCGVFDGGTMIEFSKRTNGQYRHIYGFEPDTDRYEISDAYLKCNNIQNYTLVNVGVSDKKAQASFVSDGTQGMRVRAEGNAVVNLDALDNLLVNHVPTFIKMNIEGSELAAVKGCTKIPKWGYPRLAICVNHRFTDLWEIPLYLSTKYPGYNVYLRKHGLFGGTVCYAVASR